MDKLKAKFAAMDEKAKKMFLAALIVWVVASLLYMFTKSGTLSMLSLVGLVCTIVFWVKGTKGS